MAGVARNDERARALLGDLIERVGDDRDFFDVLGSDVDADSIRMALRPLCTGRVSIDSIAINDSRIDAVVAVDKDVVRVVFDIDDNGLLVWLDTFIKPTRFSGVPGGRVVVVNGPSGAGKSTLMRAVQSAVTFPIVVFDEPEHVGTVQPGYLIWRDTAPSLHRGYLAAIAALARAGNHVTLAAAGHSHDEIVTAFAGIELIRVGLWCDLDVLVERERRTGRWAGIAAESLGIHDGWTYDLEVDTTSCPDPDELARRVLALSTA